MTLKLKISRIAALLIYGIVLCILVTPPRGEMTVDLFIFMFAFGVPLISMIYWCIASDILMDIKEDRF
jgi:hypothetical protein